MVSETDTSTLSRLLRGNDSLCQWLRSQGLCGGINNTNGKMKEKTQEEELMEKQEQKNTRKFLKRWRRKTESYSFVCLCLSAFTLAQTVCVRTD